MINFSLSLLFIIALNVFSHAFLFIQINSTSFEAHDFPVCILSITSQNHKFYLPTCRILLKVNDWEFYTLLARPILLIVNILVAHFNFLVLWDFWVILIKRLYYSGRVFVVALSTRSYYFVSLFFVTISFWVLHFRTFSFRSHRFACLVLVYW